MDKDAVLSFLGQVFKVLSSSGFLVPDMNSDSNLFHLNISFKNLLIIHTEKNKRNKCLMSVFMSDKGR